MKAEQTDLGTLLGGSNQQFIVPLFQRTYSWNKKEWQDLWDDLNELLDDEGKSRHFLGSIVTIPTSAQPHKIKQYLLIDGQQRLTTLFILLALIRNKTKESSLAEEIYDQQLINKYATTRSANCHSEKFYRLKPTQKDCAAFWALMPSTLPEEGSTFSDEFKDSAIIHCYRFFERKLHKVDLEQFYNAITQQLVVVSITLDTDENPYLVFESLNARGKPLTQADLVRNYFFMNITDNQQIEAFEDYWKPMQDTLGDSLTEYIRHYLIAVRETDVKSQEVYMTLKKHIEDNKLGTIQSLKELASYAKYYCNILAPQHELSSIIQKALARLKRLEVTVSYPFIIKCYDDYAHQKLNENNFAKILGLIENLVIRRSICNMARQGLNKKFPNLYREAKQSSPTNLVNGVANILQSMGYPSDDDFKEALKIANLYNPSVGRELAREKTKLILESLEDSYGHKEVVNLSALTIEHVMPQSIEKNAWWKEHIGEDWESIHTSYLHTLGNLTLTGYNAEMSNSEFSKKKLWLEQSHIELNRYFDRIYEWKEVQIVQRTEYLVGRALKVWSNFGDGTLPSLIKKNHGVAGTKPFTLTLKGKEQPVEFWKDVLIATLEFLITEDVNFEELAEDFPGLIAKNAFKRPIPLSNQYYVNLPAQAERVYHLCQQLMEFAGYASEDWNVEYKSNAKVAQT
ncbi:MAG: hypothetical protein RL368_1855 [Pseudomonadota bacterium]|jgi:uncharacterized protein with ParB-like and HNH nuclease domain